MNCDAKICASSTHVTHAPSLSCCLPVVLESNYLMAKRVTPRDVPREDDWISRTSIDCTILPLSQCVNAFGVRIFDCVEWNFQFQHLHISEGINFKLINSFSNTDSSHRIVRLVLAFFLVETWNWLCSSYLLNYSMKIWALLINEITINHEWITDSNSWLPSFIQLQWLSREN